MQHKLDFLKLTPTAVLGMAYREARVEIGNQLGNYCKPGMLTKQEGALGEVEGILQGKQQIQ